VYTTVYGPSAGAESGNLISVTSFHLLAPSHAIPRQLRIKPANLKNAILDMALSSCNDLDEAKMLRRIDGVIGMRLEGGVRGRAGVTGWGGGGGAGRVGV